MEGRVIMRMMPKKSLVHIHAYGCTQARSKKTDAKAEQQQYAPTAERPTTKSILFEPDRKTERDF